MAPQRKRDRDTKESLTSVQNGNYKMDNMEGSPVNGVMSDLSTTAPAANPSAVKLNSHQQEQELFLQAFEKPTQIYRFLRNRHLTSPIFLQRTLSYMRERTSYSNKKRNTFKVNSMLEVLVQKTQTLTNNYLNIIYSGLFCNNNTCDELSWLSTGDTIAIDATLCKITKSKRKDSTSDFQEIWSHSSMIICNPHDDYGKYVAASIPAHVLHPLGDQHIIYKLIFRINVKSTANNDDGQLKDASTKCKKDTYKIYGCELIVYEKNVGSIPEGDYDAILEELNYTSIKTFSPKKRSWETLPENCIPITVKYDVFTKYPALKFRLIWSRTETPNELSTIDFDKYCQFSDLSNLNDNNDSRNGNGNGIAIGNDQQQVNHNNNFIKGHNNTTTTTTTMNSNNNNNTSNIGKSKENKEKISEAKANTAKTEKVQIVYNFLYSNNTRQQTEYTQEVICPWCGLDCVRLYSLLKHLKLCHARFNFTYQPAADNGARIDVTINDGYDGSYAGSPYDLAGPCGCSFARTCGPVRRTTVTNLLVCRPRRQKTCLDEFMVLDEDELSSQRPYITGHNRLYHHTETCLPVHPKELDIDSEGESDPLWLRQKTIQMIDEFTDVNEGEKELMKLWNLHVMKHGFVGDCQLPLACEMFLDANGHDIIRKNIYRNFILHMCSLFDYGLISPETLYKIVQKLQGILSKYPEGQEMMSKQRKTQLNYWLETGIHKQDEQKLKSPQKTAGQIIGQTAANLNAACKGAVDEQMLLTSTTNNIMKPPKKRSNTAIKRPNTLPVNNLIASTAAKLTDNKNVARKSALMNEDNIKAKTTTALKYLPIADNVKTDPLNNGTRSIFSSRTHTAKRRYLDKDLEYPSKRVRATDPNSSSNSNTISSKNANNRSNTTAILNNTKVDDRKTTLMAKRVATRRQSFACLPITTNHIDSCSTNTKNQEKTCSNKPSSAAHVLRTRLSVPLNTNNNNNNNNNNKFEKR